MTPQEALRLLDQAVSAALLTRPQHARAQEAIQVLARAMLNDEADGEDKQ